MGGFYYPNDVIEGMEHWPLTIGAGAAAAIFVVYLLILFVGFAFSMLSYVLQSLSLHTVAKRRGIRHSWLAWLPVGNVWILGNISDQYQYLVKGRIKNRRKILLGLSAGLLIGYLPWLFVTLISMAAGSGGILTLGGLAIFAASIWLTICQYIAYYDFYRSCEPGNAVLFLVLSIVFPVTMPFFVFACRKKDQGMPPRKQPAPQTVIDAEIVEEPAEVEIEEGFAQPEEFEN